MQPSHETAYPTLPAELTAAELEAAFTPTPAEIRFARSQSRRASTSVVILVQLKLLQRLGYFPMLTDVPPIVIAKVFSVSSRTVPPPRGRYRTSSNSERARERNLAAFDDRLMGQALLSSPSLSILRSNSLFSVGWGRACQADAQAWIPR
ncbi:protein of unknown function [Cupriavidus taiwanensis]|uniref:DUF4158 domain-containing protein n=1 Tax=Cupriavidus taiwanensis TaxID=164546 RepID=A0A375IGZ2_9BURK|nr:DUF4158 domain-containing protein [Cupriavidus taiwanensis]SPK72485.1 protein of unknown function [Cupriavidus taiwanensis]